MNRFLSSALGLLLPIFVNAQEDSVDFSRRQQVLDNLEYHRIQDDKVYKVEEDIEDNQGREPAEAASPVRGPQRPQNFPNESSQFLPQIQGFGHEKGIYDPYVSPLGVVEPDGATLLERAILQELTDERVRDGDSRLELLQLNPLDTVEQGMLDAAPAVLALVPRNQLWYQDSSVYLDLSYDLGSYFGLCPAETYRTQPFLAYCTGFLVTPSILITAAHCADEVALSQMRILSGYVLRDETGRIDTLVDTAQVVEVDRRILLGTQLDIVALKLTRPVAGIAPLKLDTQTDKITANTPLYGLGYPLGVPLKVARFGGLVDRENDCLFATSLDLFQGNSGSPILNTNTHKVVGMLVGGGQDFRPNGPCNVAHRCQQNCPGEWVIDASCIRELLKQAGIAVP